MSELMDITQLYTEFSAFIVIFQEKVRTFYAMRLAQGVMEPCQDLYAIRRYRDGGGHHGYKLRVCTVARDFSLIRLRLRAGDGIFLPLATYLLNTYGQHGACAEHNQLEINIRVFGSDHQAARRVLMGI